MEVRSLHLYRRKKEILAAAEMLRQKGLDILPYCHFDIAAVETIRLMAADNFLYYHLDIADTLHPAAVETVRLAVLDNARLLLDKTFREVFQLASALWFVAGIVLRLIYHRNSHVA